VARGYSVRPVSRFAGAVPDSDSADRLDASVMAARVANPESGSAHRRHTERAGLSPEIHVDPVGEYLPIAHGQIVAPV